MTERVPTAMQKAWLYVADYRHARLQGSTHATCLRDLAELETAIEGVRRRLVIDMVRSGASWGEVGQALGITRQGAAAKYKRYLAPEDGMQP